MSGREPGIPQGIPRVTSILRPADRRADSPGYTLVGLDSCRLRGRGGAFTVRLKGWSRRAGPIPRRVPRGLWDACPEAHCGSVAVERLHGHGVPLNAPEVALALQRSEYVLAREAPHVAWQGSGPPVQVPALLVPPVRRVLLVRAPAQVVVHQRGHGQRRAARRAAGVVDMRIRREAFEEGPGLPSGSRCGWPPRAADLARACVCSRLASPRPFR